ncbi:MAG TPA: NAD(+)/NADH kinase [Rectinemataceae bacterium]
MASKSALIVANLLKDDAAAFSRLVETALETRGWNVESFGFEGAPAGTPVFAGKDLIVSLGGDGTLLYAARLDAQLGIPILPVNLGTLGFIAANTRTSWMESLDAWQEGKLRPSKRMMLEIEAMRGESSIGKYTALNDGVVSSQGIAKMVRLSLDLGDDRLGFYRADGIIVATPTGSTAYNLAAGGPALHPEMGAMVVNPICPFTLGSRPLVLPDSEIITISVVETRRSGAMLTVDGQETLSLEKGDVLRFTRARKDSLLVVPPESKFFEALRTKLGWSGDIRA